MRQKVSNLFHMLYGGYASLFCKPWLNREDWFVCHRIRESLREGSFKTPFGQGGKIVEADETYFGPVERSLPAMRPIGTPYLRQGRAGPASKRPIISLVERGGHVRSFHVPRADSETVTKIVNDNLSREARLFTDESKLYIKVGRVFAEHSTVNHTAKEYARGEVNTNTVEGVFSIFKRGMIGVYQHCDEKHLHRYLAEFDYRYNHREGLGFSDWERTEATFDGIVGRRLTYRRTHQAHV